VKQILTIATVLVLLLCLVVPVGAQSTGATTTTSSPPAPSITPAQATEQAASQVNKPPTVYDLTDPGIVYGMLGEGVAAWRATLTGSPNEFGVDTAPVAVQGSTRPDVVPASLQAFLLQYYKDNPNVGLAFGPAGVDAAIAQLQDDYNAAVSALADQIYQGAVANANANVNATTNTNTNTTNNTNSNDNQNNTNGANNSENVPPLDNNDNGNDNNSPPAEQKQIHVINFGSPG